MTRRELQKLVAGAVDQHFFDMPVYGGGIYASTARPKDIAESVVEALEAVATRNLFRRTLIWSTRRDR